MLLYNYMCVKIYIDAYIYSCLFFKSRDILFSAIAHVIILGVHGFERRGDTIPRATAFFTTWLTVGLGTEMRGEFVTIILKHWTILGGFYKFAPPAIGRLESGSMFSLLFQVLQLRKIYCKMSTLLSFDFVSQLPSEIVERILLYLDAPTLCKASTCCKAWRELTNNDKLW